MGLPVLGVVVALFLVLQLAPRTQVAADLAADLGPAADHGRQVAVNAAATALLPIQDRVDAVPEARTPAAEDATRGRRRHHGHRGHDHHGGRHHRKDAAEAARPGDRQDRRHDRQQDPEHKKKKQHRQQGGGMHQRAEERHKHPGGKKKNKNNNNNTKKNDKNKNKNKNDKNKTLAFPEDQQIRHRKQRQSRKKGGRRRNETVAGSTPANSTAFRRRSEEKQELVGRRTLDVLSPRGSPRAPSASPTLVGILDIPVQESTAAPAPAVVVAADPPPTPSPATKLAARAGGGGGGDGPGAGPGRRRSGGAAAAENRQPIDPEWLQRLLAAAAVTSAKAPSASPDESPCDRWMACSAKLLPAIRTQLAALPACPCTFPANVFYYNKIWDHKHARYFRWRDASGRAERLDVYHPDASYCIRSLHTAATGMLAAQHCCYDRNRQLLTRGAGAGTPALVSPDVSAALHDILDVRPWRVCKGDFTRYNVFRPPNNDNQCTANPDEGEFQRQTELSQFY